MVINQNSSLRGFEKAVAISVCTTETVKQNSSLRGFKKAVAISAWNTIIYLCNSLIFVYLQIIISFSFLFLCLLLVVYGLLRRFTPRNDKEGGMMVMTCFASHIIMKGTMMVVDCFASLAMTKGSE